MGCGKSTMAHIFSALGIPIYHADEHAKRLAQQSEVKAKIAALFGEEAAHDRKKLAQIVFASPDKLAQLNALLHPLVFADAKAWFEALQNAPNPAPYAVVEAAVLFESGMDVLFDAVITVEAPQEEQIARCMLRDHSSEEAVKARLSQQLSSEERQKKSRFVIHNASHQRVLPEVLHIDEVLRGEA